MPTDAELREQSLHVYGHLRQVLHLSVHLDRRGREGVVELVDPMDAAALAAFALSARALTDFFWRARPKPSRNPRRSDSDAFAVDWLTRDEWNPGDVPVELSHVGVRVGQDIAHISFRRLDRETDRGWEPATVAHRLAYWFAAFAAEVQHQHPERVPQDFQAQSDAANRSRLMSRGN